MKEIKVREISDEPYDEEEQDKELEIESAVDEEIDDNKLMAYDIAVFYNTYNLSTIIKWWGKKLIIPDFQRPFVWDLKRASEFVDSLLRGLPVPSLFFYDDNENARFLVVDGQQRLKSLNAFINDQQFEGKEFRLTGNIHPKWNHKSYSELDEEDRDRLDDTLMNITLMRQLAPDDGQSSMYLAFQRINTGGIALKAQEIRMAVSYGGFAILLNTLSLDKRFEKWKFLRTNKQRENNNYSPIQELILKFWTYYFNYPNNYSGSSTRVMLDMFFDRQRDFDNPKKKIQGVKYYRKEELEEAFYAAFDIVNSLPLSAISPYSKPTQTFLESIWVGLTHRKLQLRKDINTAGLEQYISSWKKKIGPDRFSELFQARRTSSTVSALDRIKAGIEFFSGDF